MQQRPRPGDPIYGTSWRRHGARRQRAARIARSLRPVAHLLGGLASTELIVPYRGRWYRPDVGVLTAPQATPHDGALSSAPRLIVCLGGPLAGRDWLAAGADVVWAYADGAVEQLTRRGHRRLARGQWLSHPGEPALRLLADDLAPHELVDARISA